MYNITVKNNQVFATTPYSPRFIDRARKLGGKWSAKESAWVFDARDEQNVRDLMVSVYGTDGSHTETVTCRLTFKYQSSFERAPAMAFGRVIAKAYGRDSGTALGEKVVFIKGRANSGGSVKNWRTIISGGSVVEIRNLPASLMHRELPKYFIDEEINVEWIEEEKTVKNHAERIAFLKAEIEKMNAEIRELQGGEPSPDSEQMPNVNEAIREIESLYPPDSQYTDTAAIGRQLMDDVAGNTVGYKNWRELPGYKLILLAQANIRYHNAN